MVGGLAGTFDRNDPIENHVDFIVRLIECHLIKLVVEVLKIPELHLLNSKYLEKFHQKKEKNSTILFQSTVRNI